MLAVASAIVPIFLLILLGYVFKRLGFPSDGFWGPAGRIDFSGGGESALKTPRV